MNEPTPKDGLDIYVWLVKEHTRLQLEADELWDALDSEQLQENFQTTRHDYNRVCDQMDLLESLPKCAYFEHRVSLHCHLSDGSAHWQCLEKDCRWAIPF